MSVYYWSLVYFKLSIIVLYHTIFVLPHDPYSTGIFAGTPVPVLSPLQYPPPPYRVRHHTYQVLCIVDEIWCQFFVVVLTVRIMRE